MPFSNVRQAGIFWFGCIFPALDKISMHLFTFHFKGTWGKISAWHKIRAGMQRMHDNGNILHYIDNHGHGKILMMTALVIFDCLYFIWNCIKRLNSTKLSTKE